MITKQKKHDIVSEVKKELASSKIVAVADLTSLPARDFNSIKKKMRGKVRVIMARKTLLERALKEAKKESLVEYLSGSPALVLTDVDAFKLYKMFKDNKNKAFAKTGSTIESDIVVPAGETNLAPGPVLTELKQVKIEAKIQGPKVVISKDATVGKKGETLTENVAKILQKLGIQTAEVGVNVRAVLQDGTVYKGDVLNVSTEEYVAQLQLAYREAMELSVVAGIYSKEAMEQMLIRAARQASKLSEKIPAESAPAAVEAPAAPATEAPATPEAPTQ